MERDKIIEELKEIKYSFNRAGFTLDDKTLESAIELINNQASEIEKKDEKIKQLMEKLKSCENCLWRHNEPKRNHCHICNLNNKCYFMLKYD